jgi:hypothetical protein
MEQDLGDPVGVDGLVEACRPRAGLCEQLLIEHHRLVEVADALVMVRQSPRHSSRSCSRPGAFSISQAFSRSCWPAGMASPTRAVGSAFHQGQRVGGRQGIGLRRCQHLVQFTQAVGLVAAHEQGGRVADLQAQPRQAGCRVAGALADGEAGLGHTFGARHVEIAQQADIRPRRPPAARRAGPRARRRRVPSLPVPGREPGPCRQGGSTRRAASRATGVVRPQPRARRPRRPRRSCPPGQETRHAARCASDSAGPRAGDASALSAVMRASLPAFMRLRLNRCTVAGPGPLNPGEACSPDRL